MRFQFPKRAVVVVLAASLLGTMNHQPVLAQSAERIFGEIIRFGVGAALEAERRRNTERRHSNPRQQRTGSDGRRSHSTSPSPTTFVQENIGSSNASFEIMAGYDLPGHDYRDGITDSRLANISQSQCQVACADDSACEAFTYNASRRICFLKSGASGPVAFGGAVSGRRVNPQVAQNGGSGSGTHVRKLTRAEVRILQTRLIESGYLNDRADGVIGPKTRAAVNSYLASRGLGPVSSVNSLTYSRIMHSGSKELDVAGGGSSGPGNPGTDAQAPVQGRQDVAANAGLDAPVPDFASAQEPDYPSLLRLYMASNADLLDNPAFALEYRRVFNISRRQDATRACMDYDDRLENPVSRQREIQDAQQELRRVLPQAAAEWPRKTVFRLSVREHLKDYDLEAQEFPVDLHSVSGLQKVSQSQIDPDARSGKRQLCMHGPGAIWRIDGIEGEQFVPSSMSGFYLKVINRELIDRLPMTAQRTEAYLNETTAVRFELLVEVGPILYRDIGQDLPARIVAARAVSSIDGSVLHTYPASLFAEDSAEEDAPGGQSPAAGPPTIPLVSHHLSLMLLRDYPDAASKDELLDFTANQVANEQWAWDKLDEMMESHQARRLDPDQPVLALEWQQMRQSNPELANKMLRHDFLLGQPEWNAITADLGLDTRLERVYRSFVFSRSAIEGRDSAFAAHEMLPVLREHLQAAVAAMNETRFFIERDLDRIRYDFDTQSYRHERKAEIAPFKAPERVAYTDVFTEEEIEDARLLMPAGLDGAPLYQLEDIDYARTSRDAHGVRVGGPIPSNSWRDMARHVLPDVDYIALDRELSFDNLPVDIQNAERIRLESLALKLRIDIEAQHVERGVVPSRNDKDEDEPVFVLVAKLLGAALMDSEGNQVAYFDAGHFASAADVAAAEAAAEAKKEAERLAALKAEEERKASLREAMAGMDIVGIRLGMTLDKAEATIRKHMDVGWVSVPEDADPKEPFSHFRAFTRADGNEVIMVFPGTATGDTVLGVSRRLRLAEGTAKDDIMNSLKGKYGKPAFQDGELENNILWTGDIPVKGAYERHSRDLQWLNTPCRISVSNPGNVWDHEIVEGDQEVRNGILNGSGIRADEDDIDHWNTCGPALLAHFNHYGTNSDGMPILSYILTDLSAYQPPYVEAQAEEKYVAPKL